MDFCGRIKKIKKKMQEMGLEPTRYCYHRHLKPARLPIPPLLHFLLCYVFLNTKYMIHDNRRFVNGKFGFYFQIILEFLNI